MRDMFRSLTEEEEEQEINVTPMLDVVFIMLIFFIVTASFVKEFGLDANRPDASEQQPPKEEDKNILVEINALNDIFIQKRPVDIRQVRANIQRLSAERPDGIVIIMPHEESEVDVMVQVMDASRQAGVYEISLADATQ